MKTARGNVKDVILTNSIEKAYNYFRREKIIAFPVILQYNSKKQKQEYKYLTWQEADDWEKNGMWGFEFVSKQNLKQNEIEKNKINYE